jgi:hypothetical protein
MRSKLARKFTERTEKHGTNWRVVAAIKCRLCGVEDVMGIKGPHTLLPTVAIAKKFAQRGWEIGQNEHWDTCPECLKKQEKPKLKIVPKVEEKVPDMLKPEPPRAMGREDRRIIFDKLNGVYLDERRGYDAGWSDHKVSTDLGVPRAWVEQVREEMFGPVNSNPDIEAFVKAVRELQEVKDQLSKMAAFRDQIEGIKNAIGGVNLASVLDRVTKLEKVATEVRKHIPG